ncbi:MAG: DUF421 domain-containing protein [Gemmataceae bacterium]
MAVFQPPDWGAMFVPNLSLLESFLRGTLVYFAVLALFRVFPRRQLGSVGLTDMLFVVLVSEGVSQALNANSPSLPNGVAAVTALLVWNFVLDWAAYRWRWVQRLLGTDPVPLVRDGRLLRENLERQKITEDELLAQLRQNGIDRVGAVKSACLEAEGQVSVVPKDDPPPVSPPAGPPDFDDAVRAFLEAAERVEAAVGWHERQAAAHAEQARNARELLARHGVRRRKSEGSTRGRRESDPSPQIRPLAG